MPAGGAPAASSGTPGEMWATASLYHMLDDMLTARAGNQELREQLSDAQAAAAARTSASVDPESGLTAPDFLQRWAAPADAATLPIGLGLFDVSALDTAAMRADPRASYHAAHHIAAALTQPLGPVDAAVRLSTREFLVVVPGASERHLAAVCDQIGEQLELASRGYPHVSLRARTATIVTRVRPLPLRDLQESLGHLGPDDAGPFDTGVTPAGDRIVVASTRLHAPDEHAPDEPARDEHARAGGDRPDAHVAEANGAPAPAGLAPPSPAPLPRRTAAAVLDALIAESSDSPAR
jgi:GGDEF domain-containing protein